MMPPLWASRNLETLVLLLSLGHVYLAIGRVSMLSIPPSLHHMKSSPVRRLCSLGIKFHFGWLVWVEVLYFLWKKNNETLFNKKEFSQTFSWYENTLIYVNLSLQRTIQLQKIQMETMHLQQLQKFWDWPPGNMSKEPLPHLDNTIS